MIKMMKLLLTATLLMTPILSYAAVVTESISYEHDGVTMRGMIAYDDASDERRPGVLVVHEWWGHNDYARERARKLAEAGYTALAVDMYGDGRTASHPKDAGSFARAVGGDIELARGRFEAALKTLNKHHSVDPERTAAIGYCFGGGIVLNMARLGLDIDAVASYHGSLISPLQATEGKLKAAVRVFNGVVDPMVKREHVQKIKDEMSSARADFEIFEYAGATHGFTNPAATATGMKFDLPLAYDAAADEDSWKRTLDFFRERLAQP